MRFSARGILIATMLFALFPRAAAQAYPSKLIRVTGIDMLHVPYKGAAPATNAVVAGQVDIYFPGTSAVKPLLPGGKLKVLGIVAE